MIAADEKGITGKAQEVVQWLFAFTASWRDAGKEGEPEFTVKVRRRKRSLDQNAYYWVLLSKLAPKLGMGHQECHSWMVRSYAPYAVITVRQDVPVERFCEYCDVVREHIWLDGKEWKNARIFTRSSQMTTEEFSKLLDGMIQECEQQGIETMTPAELAKLREVVA